MTTEITGIYLFPMFMPIYHSRVSFTFGEEIQSDLTVPACHDSTACYIMDTRRLHTYTAIFFLGS